MRPERAQPDFDAQRAAEKQRDREAGARAVASGAKSPVQLNRENDLGSALEKRRLRAGRPAKL